MKIIKKIILHTKFDIYVFIIITGSITAGFY